MDRDALGRIACAAILGALTRVGEITESDKDVDEALEDADARWFFGDVAEAVAHAVIGRIAAAAEEKTR